MTYCFCEYWRSSCWTGLLCFLLYSFCRLTSHTLGRYAGDFSSSQFRWISLVLGHHNPWASLGLYYPRPGCQQVRSSFLPARSCISGFQRSVAHPIIFLLNILSITVVITVRRGSLKVGPHHAILPRNPSICVFNWINYLVVIFLSSFVGCEWLEQAPPSLHF